MEMDSCWTLQALTSLQFRFRFRFVSRLFGLWVCYNTIRRSGVFCRNMGPMGSRSIWIFSWVLWIWWDTSPEKSLEGIFLGQSKQQNLGNSRNFPAPNNKHRGAWVELGRTGWRPVICHADGMLLCGSTTCEGSSYGTHVGICKCLGFQNGVNKSVAS